MPEHDGLMRVFWPTDIAKSDLPGVIVGWRNSGLDVVVVAVLDHVDVSFAVARSSPRPASSPRLTLSPAASECRKRLEDLHTPTKRAP